MNRIAPAWSLTVVIVALSIALAAPSSAAQPFFEGAWRCQHGMTLNVGRGFGPWYVWRSLTPANEARAFIRNTPSGTWVNIGANNTGGWWTSTSPGWRGQTLTFTGTYGTLGSGESFRQVYTRNSPTAVTIQTWRNGSLVGQVGCNR